MKRRVTVVAIVLLSVAALFALSSGDDDRPRVGQARLMVNGAVTVTGTQGRSEVVTAPTTLVFGDVVEVTEGTALLELPGGKRYEFRAGEDNSEVRIGEPPTLLAGDGLVAGGYPAEIDFGGSTLSASGALKVVASIPTATAYDGRTVITGGGDTVVLPALRRVVLTESPTPRPLRYDAADPWDRRFLGETIAFGDRLEALARGYTADLRLSRRPADFYASVIPALGEEPDFGDDLVDYRPPGETLVGAAIAVQGRRGTFGQRWQEVFAFRDEGAAWGLVARDQGVRSAPVLEIIEVAISEPPPPPVEPRPTPTPIAPPPVLRPDPPPPTTTVPTTRPPISDPFQPPPAPDDGGLLSPLLDPVTEILDAVLGSLGLG